MQLTDHFSVPELTRSSTADRLTFHPPRSHSPGDVTGPGHTGPHALDTGPARAHHLWGGVLRRIRSRPPHPPHCLFQTARGDR